MNLNMRYMYVLKHMAPKFLSVPFISFFTLLGIQYQDVTNKTLCKTVNMEGNLWIFPDFADACYGLI